MAETMFGKYRVIEQVGVGGMGVVFSAEHSLIGNKVAIKVLRPEVSHNQTLVTRFFNEARATASIHHPGIVDIFDFGQAADGSAYFVMEWLEGESLSERIRKAVLSELTTARFVRQIAAALQATHDQGIVHRDLKPDNLYVVPDADVQGGERIKILDFGIAKLAPGMATANARSTVGLVGTPSYMSPEQCRGRGGVDHRTDIYSLGCVMYEMLCGRPPFDGTAAGELIASHLTMAPPRPSGYRPGLSRGMERVVGGCLQKDPDRRFQSMEAVKRAVEDATAGRIVTPNSIADGTGDPDFDSEEAPTIVPTDPWSDDTVSHAKAPPPASGPSHTTLRSATGSIAESKEPAQRWWWAAALLLVVGGIGAAAFFVFEDRLLGGAVAERDPGSGPENQTSANQPAGGPSEPLVDAGVPPMDAGNADEQGPVLDLVPFTIESIPPGATVTDLATMKEIGDTPVSIDVVRSGMTYRYKLEKSGFKDRTIEMLANQSRNHTTTLEPRRKSHHDRPRSERERGDMIDPFAD